METILFLVESPHKAETLAPILGKKYKIMATVGHLMDLDPLSMSIDIEHDFTPIYVQNKDKLEVISKIKSAAKNAKSIIFASDPDREGEMISWNAAQILGVENPQRVTYTEITKEAVLEAIKHPRDIDMALIDAQKTRRILDRIVGYSVSPLLVKVLSMPHLSAGRVQSVVARLIIDKEMEIKTFLSGDTKSSFKIDGTFEQNDDTFLAKLFNTKETKDKTETDKNKDKEQSNEDEIIQEEKGLAKIKTYDKAMTLMNFFTQSKMTVKDIEEKLGLKNPSPPFSTSTMQQTSATKLGFNVKRTMTAAQNLHEAGYITYLRTDSVHLSNEALENIGKYVVGKYGKEYHRRLQYKSKSKNTQEAHEAIRPTNVNNVDNLTGRKIGNDEIKLYSLIWKRAVASQMTPAKLKRLIIHINISNVKDYEFISTSETITFPGFLRVYNIQNAEPSDNDNENVTEIKKIPKLKSVLKIKNISSIQSYQKPPSRYNDASLVNKINPDNLNIGRPATTQTILSVIQDRGYVKKGDVEGIEKDVKKIMLDEKLNLTEEQSKIMLGHETNKFIPTDLGIAVNDFLMQNFPEIMDYKFTSDMEDKLDEIAENKINWLNVMKTFYDPFNKIVEHITENLKELVKKNTKILGYYPDTNEKIVVSLAKYGPVVKMRKNKKYVYAPIQTPLTIENITLQDALKLLEYPKLLGEYNKKDVNLQKGKFGFYITYDNEKISVGEKNDITLEEAIEEINKKNSKNLWKETDGKYTYKILEGPYGKYINVTGPTKGANKRGKNVKLPKDIEIKDITLEIVKDLVSKWKPKRKFFKKKD